MWVGVCEPPEGRAGALWAPELHVVCDPLRPVTLGRCKRHLRHRGLERLPEGHLGSSYLGGPSWCLPVNGRCCRLL